MPSAASSQHTAMRMEFGPFLSSIGPPVPSIRASAAGTTGSPLIQREEAFFVTSLQASFMRAGASTTV